jgi:hypothetical protein
VCIWKAVLGAFGACTICLHRLPRLLTGQPRGLPLTQLFLQAVAQPFRLNYRQMQLHGMAQRAFDHHLHCVLFAG